MGTAEIMVKTFMGTAEILIKTSVDSGAGRWGIALRNGLGQLNLRENFSGAWYASGGAGALDRPRVIRGEIGKSPGWNASEIDSENIH